MRLSRSLSLAILCASLVSSSNIINQDDSFPWPWPHRPRTTTIIDLLSTNAEFGPLLKALQRTSLIPLLNSSDNVTLIAPIADAMNDFTGDLTRDLLLYHILNGSVISSMVEDEIVMESLLKMDAKDNSSLGVGVKIERQGDRGRGQGVLMMGGCARVVKSDWEANNGVVQVVDKLMSIPETIDSILGKLDSVSTFNSLFDKTAFPHAYSIFVPDDDSFDELHPVELSYLKTKFGQKDRENLLYRHASRDILYSKDLRKSGNTSSLEGEKLYYKSDKHDLLVDDANITQSDIVARNGVIHIISKLILPSSVVFTPLKYLYGLHDTIFAETLAASDSFPLANDSSIRQTILAPTDNAYADSIDTEEVLKQVRYNFLEKPIDMEKLEHGDLLRTKYEVKALNGESQMVKVTKVDDKILLNNDAEVLLDPVHSGNTVIYNIGSKLSPPGPLRPTSSEGLSLFRSFHHLVSRKLDQQILFDEEAITVFLPVDHAWKTLGLAEKYLLSKSAGDDLRKVLLHCILKGVHYSKDLPSDTKSFTSLNGDKVMLHYDGKHLTFDDLDMKATMDERDILASNGVAHSLSTVPIPSTVVITPENLINATGATKWREILEQYNLTQYLDLNSNHTLLVPTDEAINISPIKTLKKDAIKSLIDFHIIPPTNGHAPADLLSDTPVTEHTIAGRAIQVRKIYTDIWSIQVNDSTNAARVLDQGKTSTGAQIILIDKVLFEPTQVKFSWAKPLAVIIFGIAMTVIIASAVGYGIRKYQKRRETKPLFQSDEEHEPFLNGSSS